MLSTEVRSGVTIIQHSLDFVMLSGYNPVLCENIGVYRYGTITPKDCMELYSVSQFRNNYLMWSLLLENISGAS